MRRRLFATVTACALVAVTTGCDTSSAPAAYVELKEFSISGPQRLSSSTDTIAVSNSGEFTHTLVITDADGEVAAATGLIQPGETTYLGLDLTPGEYVFTCRMIAQDSEGNIIDHYEAGMHAGVVVGG